MLADNTQQARIQRLMSSLNPVCRGNIRWILEEVWEQSDPEARYPRNPDRVAHPGCVQSTPNENTPVVVVIHGHTKPSQPMRYELDVRGITQEARITFFSIPRRYPVPASFFWSKNHVWAEGLSKSMLSSAEMLKFQQIETLYSNDCRRHSQKESKARFAAAHAPKPCPDVISAKETGKDSE